MNPLYILGAAALGGAVLLSRRAKASGGKLTPTNDPGEPGTRDPTKLPKPSQQDPKPKPKPPAPKPTPTPPEPGEEWGYAEGIDWGDEYLLVQESNTGKWRYGYEPVPFMAPFTSATRRFTTGRYDSRDDAIWHAANHGEPKVEYRVLVNEITPTGREVVYFDHGYGVRMVHVADPLSPTGVTIQWAVYSKDVTVDDNPFATGSAPTEDQALVAVEEVVAQ